MWISVETVVQKKQGEIVTIKLFGRSGCARTRRVYLRLSKWIATLGESTNLSFIYFDLETAAGLAEAAYEQLEGNLPVLIVEAVEPGTAISGEPLFRDRNMFSGEEEPIRFFPSRN